MLGFKSNQTAKAEMETFLQDKLQNGENIVTTAIMVREIPSMWWGFLSWLIVAVGQKFYRLVLTNQRLIFIEVGMTNNLQSYIAYNLTELKVKKISGLGILSKTLHLVLPDGTIKKLVFSAFGPDKGVINQVYDLIPKLT